MLIDSLFSHPRYHQRQEANNRKEVDPIISFPVVETTHHQSFLAKGEPG